MPRQLMQSIQDGERLAGPGVLLGLAALLCLLVASLGLTLDYRAELRNVKQTIYERCLQRDAYDRASQESRQAQVELYEALAVTIRERPADPLRFPEAIRQRQLDALERATERTTATLNRGVTTPCTVFR